MRLIWIPLLILSFVLVSCGPTEPSSNICNTYNGDTYLNNLSTPEPCSRISDKYKRDSCLYNLSRTTNSLQPCLSLTLQIDKDICISIYAYSNNNSQPCSLVINQKHKDDCYYQVARMSKNLSLCQCISVKSSENSSVISRDKCFIAMAQVLDNPTICELVAVSTQRDRCYWIMGGIAGFNVCDKIKDRSLVVTGPFIYYNIMDACYMGYAYLNNKSSYCDRVINITYRQMCKENLIPSPPKNISNISDIKYPSIIINISECKKAHYNFTFGNGIMNININGLQNGICYWNYTEKWTYSGAHTTSCETYHPEDEGNVIFQIRNNTYAIIGGGCSKVY